MIKVERPNLYWTEQHSAMWGFYWSLESRKLLLDSKYDFVKAYIKICVKYGICIPVDYLSGKSIEEIVTSCLERTNDRSDWYILHNLYVKPGYSTPIFPCLMYAKRDNDVQSDFYISVSPLSDFEGKGELVLNPYINHLCKVWSYNKSDNSERSIIFYLETDAFFNELSNHSLADNIDNSELAYFNTPRLNSFIRDMSALFFAFGAKTMAVDNLCEAVEAGQSSKFFLNDFLRVGGEVIFYEDIYSLLPEAIRYKEFEMTEVVIDGSSYNQYLKKQNS